MFYNLEYAENFHLILGYKFYWLMANVNLEWTWKAFRKLLMEVGMIGNLESKIYSSPDCNLHKSGTCDILCSLLYLKGLVQHLVCDSFLLHIC